MIARPDPAGFVPSYRLYRERSGESAQFWIHCETVPERTHLHNWEIAPHRHDSFFQIFALTAGHGDLTGDGATQPFDAPCAVFIPPEATHGFRFSRDIDGLVVTAVADRLGAVTGADRSLAGFLDRRRIVQLDPSSQDASLCSAAIAGIHAELASPRAGHDLMLEALVTTSLMALARVGAVRDAGSDVHARDMDRLRQVEKLISIHYRENKPVAFYADAVGLSGAHLNRLARTNLGTSVGGLVARRLLEVARRDLVFTPTSVQAIAYSLGFSDPAYFNRFFRRHTGQTPGAFRNVERGRILTAQAAAQ